ncbi:MAG TPA: hypothetical protein VL173_03360 [Vicinamibacterales bacterium]|nr:hypothetical protein [Vicinamibacterales bacterium]
MATRIFLLMMTASLCSACGGEALSQVSSPSTGPETLRPGSYWLHLRGPGISLDPAIPVCENPLIAGGAAVTTTVTLTTERSGWVARSAQATVGDLLVAFSEARSNIAVLSLTGSIGGTAVDMQYNDRDVASGVSIVIRGTGGGPAELSGESGRGSGIATGVVTGEITFTDAAGRVSTCATILWDLISFS